MKKPRLSGNVPEVHVAVNIASPLPGTDPGGAYAVNATTHSGYWCPLSSSAGAPSKPQKSILKQLNQVDPHVCLLLQLMDIDDPAEDLKYISIEPELIARGTTGILEVDRMPREELS